MLRQLMLEESEEYLSRSEVPPWLWFVFDDAGVGVDMVAYAIFSEDQDGDWTVLSATADQLSNANANQIRTYAMARDVWLEMT